LSDTQTSAEVPKQHPIGPIDVEIDGAMHRITIPENCSGYEAAQLAQMLAFATIANYALSQHRLGLPTMRAAVKSY
jgi:hypothetical protein